MKVYVALTVWLMVCLSGCSREVPQVSNIGKIRHTEIISKPMFDLDAYHAPRIRQEFCTSDNQVCVVGRHFDLDIFESPDSGRLLITTNIDGKNKPATGTYLFDTTKGEQIICESCGWEKEQFYAAAWLHKGQILLSSAGPGPDGESRMRVIEIEGGRATQRFVPVVELEENSAVPMESSEWFVSPNSDAVAIFTCSSQNCWLSWFGGELNKEHIQSVNCAKEASYFTVYWEGDVPHIAQTSWAKGVAIRHRCKNADGSNMYPILNRDVYTEGRSATAADIKVGE